MVEVILRKYGNSTVAVLPPAVLKDKEVGHVARGISPLGLSHRFFERWQDAVLPFLETLPRLRQPRLRLAGLRAAALGRVTLETPAEFAHWLQAGQQLDAQRQVKKDAIELDRKIRFKQIPRPS